MTAQQLPDDDAVWRRPADGVPSPTGSATPDHAAATGPATEPPAYDGPPPTVAPPAGWHPPVVMRPAPPRALPPQDAGLAAEERSAQVFTYGVGMIAGAVMLILLFVLCGRALT